MLTHTYINSHSVNIRGTRKRIERRYRVLEVAPFYPPSSQRNSGRPTSTGCPGHAPWHFGRYRARHVSMPSGLYVECTATPWARAALVSFVNISYGLRRTNRSCPSRSYQVSSPGLRPEVVRHRFVSTYIAHSLPQRSLGLHQRTSSN